MGSMTVARELDQLRELGYVVIPDVLGSDTLRAVRRWRYNPKIVDGEPVPRPGVRVLLRFDVPRGR